MWGKLAIYTKTTNNLKTKTGTSTHINPLRKDKKQGRKQTQYSTVQNWTYLHRNAKLIAEY